MKNDIMLVGGANVDIMIAPIEKDAVTAGKTRVENIRMLTGGDALNESITLARLGHAPALVTVLGRDDAGDYIRAKCEKESITILGRTSDEIDTSVNAVLVNGKGERGFITQSVSSIRVLSKETVFSAFETEAYRSARLVCLASMFISNVLSVNDMAEIFSRVKSDGKLLCADTTSPKKRERVADIAEALQYLDCYYPNYDEAVMMTGETDRDKIADAFISSGVKCVALKLGGEGCLVKTRDARYLVPGYPDTHCVDTTGAGDSFAAAFNHCLINGENVFECACFANAVASICVEAIGATQWNVNIDEIDRRAEIIKSIYN